MDKTLNFLNNFLFFLNTTRKTRSFDRIKFQNL